MNESIEAAGVEARRDALEWKKRMQQQVTDPSLTVAHDDEVLVGAEGGLDARPFDDLRRAVHSNQNNSTQSPTALSAAAEHIGSED